MTRGMKEDLSGQTFGKLFVLKKVKINKHTHYLCECDCENKTQKICRSDILKDGLATHCGCDPKYKHGMTNTRPHNIWSGMKNRILNNNDEHFHRYGGRGIRICDEWLDQNNGFNNFYCWALENGYAENLTIDRINNDGNYEPSNCRWATSKEQSNNISTNHNLEINGEIKSASEWARISGISRFILKKRYKLGIRGDLLFEKVEIPKAEFISGVVGIRWEKTKGRWKSDIKEDGKIKHIRYYKLDDLETAIKEREEYIENRNKMK